jgi:flagellar hook protein FlgE
MNSLSSIAQSGMNAAQLRLNAAGHNIANLQTPGFRRELVVSEAQAGGGVTASVAQATVVGESLADDLVQTMVAAYSFKANLKTLQTQYSLLGSLLDLKA